MKEILSKYNQVVDFGSRGKRTWKILFLILALAFCLRIFLIIYPEVIHNDATEYIRNAKQILSGDWTGGKAPPLYPFLIALAHSLTQNYELAGILVSVIFGSLIVLPVFYLGRSIFNEKVGIVSSLLAAVHPFLYISSGSVLTESTYHFLLATSVFFGWKAFCKGRLLDILLFSLFTALAYLTRPEAIGFLFVFAIWILLVHPPDAKRLWIKKLGIIVVATLSFLIFSSPYLIQIRKETGRWGISKKVSLSMGSLSEEENAPSIEAIKKGGMTLSSFVKNPLLVSGKVGVGFFQSLYKFQQVYNPMLSFLAVLGLIFLFAQKRRKTLRGSFYLISYFIFFFGLVLPFFWITRRYTSQLISIAIPWAALGFLVFTEWIHQRWKFVVSKERFTTVLILIVLIILFVQGRVIHPREHRFIQREAGLWMRGHLPRGAKVMSPLPQEAFYAELPWVRMPEGSYDEILKEARFKKVQYLIVDESIEKDSPDFVEKSRGGDLIQLRDWERKSRRIVLFQVIYPKGK
jgi:4-amino-4-deoxy-L-arabinose transferase-like glycosyltransferase